MSVPCCITQPLSTFYRDSYILASAPRDSRKFLGENACLSKLIRRTFHRSINKTIPARVYKYSDAGCNRFSRCYVLFIPFLVYYCVSLFVFQFFFVAKNTEKYNLFWSQETIDGCYSSLHNLSLYLIFSYGLFWYSASIKTPQLQMRTKNKERKKKKIKNGTQMPVLMVVTDQAMAMQTQPTSTTTLQPSPSDSCNRTEGSLLNRNAWLSDFHSWCSLLK